MLKSAVGCWASVASSFSDDIRLPTAISTVATREELANHHLAQSQLACYRHMFKKPNRRIPLLNASELMQRFGDAAQCPVRAIGLSSSLVPENDFGGLDRWLVDS